MNSFTKDSSQSTRGSERSVGRISVTGRMIRLVIPLGILVAGAIGYKVLSVKPEPPPAGKSAPKPLRTRVMPLEKGDYPVIIRTQGVVRSHNEVTLTSQVNGRIQTISPEFQVGAFFREGDILLELDPVDFEVAVVSAEAQLARAETVFAQEQTRARQAKRNWEDLGYEEEPNELVLRLPQLKEAEINVQSAQAQLESARRNLERSRVRAPFDGRVLTRQIGVGQTINGSTPLGTVFATDYAEVRLPLSATDLRFLDLPEKPDDEPLKVELRDALDPAANGVREAMITRTEGALDENTLELFVIARIEDPFGVESGSIPLRIGQPVVAEIQGNTVEDAFKVPRSAVFELNKIIVIDPETMELSNKVIQILYGTEDELLIEDPGISPGALLATTRLVYAPEGAKVQVITKSLSEVPLQGTVSTNKTTKPAAGGGQGGTD